jgi:hypothetical protein
MSTDLSWLAGKRLVEAAKKDWTWFFTFADGGSIATESDWRLVTKSGIEVASEDHGQIFGLKAPVDAGERVITATKNKKIIDYRIAERTSDLVVRFEDDVSLEFLNLSCGYESWRAQHDEEEVICMGGGQLAIFPKEKEANQAPEPTAPSGRGSS